MLSELVGDPGYGFEVEGCERGRVEGPVDFDVGAAFYGQLPYLVAGEEVKGVEAQPNIAH